MLSRHFTLAGFLHSDKANELGDPNTPEEKHLRALHATACGMEQVRAILGGEPITITSGYRNPRVNAAVGGVPHSAHALGYAADFYHSQLPPYDAAKALEKSFLAFDQLILETSRNIIHVSFDPRMRRQVMTQPNGPGTPCLPGIVR